MRESEPKKDKEKLAEIETVRCIIINEDEQILLLKKYEPDSNIDLFEFPGGKIDHIASDKSTSEEQLDAIIREVAEETGINLVKDVLRRVNDYIYEFKNRGRRFKRRVHTYKVQIKKPSIIILNQSLNEMGELENEHSGYSWVSLQELIYMRNANMLTGNSINFDAAF